MPFAWKGVFPALTTKFTNDDELDLPLFEKNLKAQLDAGVEGIILGRHVSCWSAKKGNGF
jgi:4-hydroxy-tetrahydrodipicolinate synthase